VKKTGFYKKTGEGLEKVRWTAEIPSDGDYDIFFYTPGYRSFPRDPVQKKPLVQDFHFIISRSGGTEEKTLDLQKTEDGWTYLSTCTLNKGTATVELSDKSNGRIVYADAVKWVKK
jgi:hypothetical protein